MKVVILGPKKEWHTNSALKGFADIPDLPVTTFHFDAKNAVASIWKVDWLDRLKFLFDGRINLVVMGQTHPPVSVSIGEYFRLGGQ